MSKEVPNKLRDFIKSIRNCKTAAEERAIIQKEKALIRESFKVSFLLHLIFKILKSPLE